MNDGTHMAQARATLAALLRALDGEREAVARLDVAALARAQADKTGLIAALEQVRALCDGDGVARAALRDELLHVVYRASANAALLSDASDALAERLGVRREPATYDAHARVHRAPSGARGRAA
jgi:hypothetical protein